MMDIITPHVRQKREEEDRLRREKLVGQAHRITCPYCIVGAAVITTELRQGRVDVPNGKVVKCSTCNRYFEIGLRIKLFGRKLRT